MLTLVVLSCEVGGRWGTDSLKFVRRLARARARGAPPLLRASARQAWANRWWGLLSVAVQDALAATLTRQGHQAMGGFEADVSVPLEDVLQHAEPSTAVARLPLRQ